MFHILKTDSGGPFYVFVLHARSCTSFTKEVVWKFLWEKLDLMRDAGPWEALLNSNYILFLSLLEINLCINLDVEFLMAVKERQPRQKILFCLGFLQILSAIEKIVFSQLVFVKSQKQLLVILRVKRSSLILNVESSFFNLVDFKSFMMEFQSMAHKWINEEVITISVTDFCT